MIEIICKETGQLGAPITVKPPKNIRQIGSPRGRHKIYVEDYVYTFLHSSSTADTEQKRAAILLGKNEVAQDIRYTFISGAVHCNEFVFGEEGIIFDADCWDYIYKEKKQYFEQQEIVGWFLGVTGFPLELTPAIEAAHRKYFAGRDKVLFLSELAEQEDVFYSYEQGILQKKEGYYIYYEKNLPMQEYMVCRREQRQENAVSMEQSAQESVIAEPGYEEFFQEKIVSKEEQPNSPAEQALRNYRSTLLKKRGHIQEKKMNFLLYTAAAAAMVVLCVIGITTIDNYEKMSQIEQALSVISTPGEKGNKEKEEGADNAAIMVEAVPGEVEPERAEETESKPKPQQATEEEPKPETEQSQEGAEEKPEPEQSQEGAESKPEAEQTEEKSEPEQTEEKPETEQSQEGTEPQPETEQSQEGAEPRSEAEQSQETAVSTFLEQGYYIVQPGDKLEVICKKIYHTAAMMDKLREANHIEDADKIYVGQKLVLP